MNISLSTNPYTRKTQMNNQAKSAETSKEQGAVAARMETGRDKTIISEEARQALAQTLEASVPAGTSGNAGDAEIAILAKLCKYTDVVNEHYEKVNEENKRFENPMVHIQRKYYDRFYPHYVEGLTNLEREICVENEEKAYLGQQPCISFYDPVIQEAISELDPGEDEAAQRLVGRHKEYQEERLETLSKEKTMPNHYDLFRWNTVQVIPHGTTKTYDELLMEERIRESAMYYHYFLKLNENADDGQGQE